jgi:hypothetical protein
VRCDHCVLRAYDTLREGDGFEGIRKARRRRRQVGGDPEVLVLCHEHAAIQREQDDIDYPANEAKTKARTGGQRYVA